MNNCTSHPPSPPPHDVENDAATPTIRFRVALEADRAAMCQLVITQHLALSRDCPLEWLEQFRDIVVEGEYNYFLSAEHFARGHFRVATVVTAEDTTDNAAKERIVGVAGVIPQSGNSSIKKNKNKQSDRTTWIVTAVAVDPRFRRRGVAEKLLRSILWDAFDLLGLQRLELETLLERMEPAWRLYEKLGFTRVDSRVEFPATGPERPQPLTVLHYAIDLTKETVVAPLDG